jgi:hypothetical protein
MKGRIDQLGGRHFHLHPVKLPGKVFDSAKIISAKGCFFIGMNFSGAIGNPFFSFYTKKLSKVFYWMPVRNEVAPIRSAPIELSVGYLFSLIF